MAKKDFQLIILEYNDKEYNVVMYQDKGYKLICDKDKFKIFDTLEDIKAYETENNITICIDDCPYYNLSSFNIKFITSPDADICQLLLELYNLASASAQTLNVSFIGDDDEECDMIYDALCFSCETEQNAYLEKDELKCLHEILKQGKQIILSGLI